MTAQNPAHRLDVAQECDTPLLPMNAEPILRSICSNPRAHARWLNTLALLEHIGCRKIVKALDSNALSAELLRHIAEEARHAHFFKALSLKVAPGLCPDFAPETLLSGVAARAYFQTLDQQVARRIEAIAPGPHETVLTYLCVTTLVERRALHIYGAHQRVIESLGLPLSLRSVLAEEERHMAEMNAAFSRYGFSWEQHSDALLDLEASLFSVWWESLHHEVQNLASSGEDGGAMPRRIPMHSRL